MTVKHETSQTEEVQKVAFPIFICNWIFGIGILEYPLGRPRRLFSGLYTANILIVYCLLAVYSYSHIIEFSRQIEANESIANIFFCSHVLLTVTSILLGWRRSRGMSMILEQGIIAGKFLQKIEINSDSQKIVKLQLRRQLIHVVMIVVAASMINFSYFYKKHLTTANVISIVIYNYPLIGMSLADATFFNLVQYSGLKFKNLNDSLKNALTSSLESPQHLKILKYYEDEIDPLDQSSTVHVVSDKVYTISMASRKAHLNFTIFCEKINTVYAIHILISVVVAIFILTMSFYHSYGVFTSGTSGVTSYQKVFPMMATLVIYNSIKIYKFTKCCSNVIQETVTTGDIISEMYDEIINEQSKIEIRHFEIQLIQHPLKFHLCNFVALDYGLTQKVIGCITTYLVILTQCGKVTLRLSE